MRGRLYGINKGVCDEFASRIFFRGFFSFRGVVECERNVNLIILYVVVNDVHGKSWRSSVMSN